MALGTPFYIFISIFSVALWLGWTRLIGAEFFPTPDKNLDKIMKMAGVGPGVVFYDLGCGDGRAVVKADKHGAKAFGIEADPLRYLLSEFRLKIAGVQNASIKLGNFFNEDLSDADVVFLFQSDKTNEDIKKKLLSELDSGTKVITYYWPFEGWEAVAEDPKNELYLYEI